MENVELTKNEIELLIKFNNLDKFNKYIESKNINVNFKIQIIENALNIHNIELSVTEKIILLSNCYYIFENYGKIIPTNEEKLSLYTDSYGIFHKLYIDMKRVKEEFLNKYINIYNRMYEIYKKKTKGIDNNIYFYFLLSENILLNLNIDQILKEYNNITIDDILTICIYTKDKNKFYEIITLLNKLKTENKEYILEYIKPYTFDLEFDKYISEYEYNQQILIEYLNIIINKQKISDNDYNKKFKALYPIYKLNEYFINQIEYLQSISNDKEKLKLLFNIRKALNELDLKTDYVPKWIEKYITKEWDYEILGDREAAGGPTRSFSYNVVHSIEHPGYLVYKDDLINKYKITLEKIINNIINKNINYMSNMELLMELEEEKNIMAELFYNYLLNIVNNEIGEEKITKKEDLKLIKDILNTLNDNNLKSLVEEKLYKKKIIAL